MRAAETMIRIHVTSGKDAFTYDYEGAEPLTIGRLPTCHLPIASTDVSREHCSIAPDGKGGFKIVDLGSKNGVRLAGQRVQEARLGPGDCVQLAPGVELTFGEIAPAAPKAAPPAKRGAEPSNGAREAPAGELKARAAEGEPPSPPPPAPAASATTSGSGDPAEASDDSPAARAKRRIEERQREHRLERLLVLAGILVFLAALGYGGWLIFPAVTTPAPAEVASGGSSTTSSTADPLSGLARPLPVLDTRPNASPDEKEWTRLAGLSGLEPELLAAAFDDYAKKFPGSRHARAATTRASSLRKVKQAGGSAGEKPEAAQGAFELEVASLVKSGSFADAAYLASVAPRLGLGDRTAGDRAMKSVEKAAYEKFAEVRDQGRALAKDGRPLDAYEFVAVQAMALRRLSFYGEVELELRNLKQQVDAALSAGTPSAPAGGSGDRGDLERLVPLAKRALVGCEFDQALDAYRQILDLPLTDQERLEFQWRVFDCRRARDLFQAVLQRVAASTGEKPTQQPLQLTITQSWKGNLVDGDASGIKVDFTIPGEGSQVQHLERKWRDLAPFQTLEIFRGLELDGDGLIALATFCFAADYDIDAHAALVSLWDDKRWKAFRPEAAALLRRRTGVNAAPDDLLTFEGRVIPKKEKDRILAARAEAKAEAERIKAEIAAAKRDATGKVWLERCEKLLDAGMYVEAREALVGIYKRMRDTDVAKQARARWEDPFLRRRSQERKDPLFPEKKNMRDDNRLSIYAMGEGWPVEKNEEQQSFDHFADHEKQILEKADFFKEYDNYINYYAMNLWSKERGISREPGGIKKDTPLGGMIDHGLFTVNNGMVHEYLKRFPGPAVGIGLGNDNANVATGGGGACAIVKGMIDVAAHEIGHAFGAVGDEYAMDPSGKPNGPRGRSKDPLPTSIISTNLVGGNNKEEIRKMAPWAHWIAIGTKNWTGKIVDIFEGGNRTPWDVWRPQADCRMRTASSGYCCVCMEQMVLHLYADVHPIDEVDPKDDKVEIEKNESVILKATCLRPRSRPLDAKWEIADAGDVDAPDGSTVVRQGKSKKLDNVKQIDLPDGRELYGAKVTASPGLYDVKLTISDPTPWVAVAERPGLAEVRMWRLKVKGR